MNLTISTKELIVLGALSIVLLSSIVTSVLLLLRAERSAQSEDALRRVFRNSTLPLAIQLVVRAIDFAFFWFFYRWLAEAKGSIGDYELAALLVTLYLGTISEWGLGVLLTREVARDRGAIRNSFGTALLLRIGLSVLALPAAFLVVSGSHLLQGWGFVDNAVSHQGAVLVGVLALTLVPGAIGSSVTAVFLAAERPVIPALANLLNNAVSAGLRLGLLFGWGVLGVAWGAVAATLLNMVVFLWLLRRHFGWPGWNWDSGLARMMLGAAFPLMLNSLLVSVFFRFDMFIVNSYWGPAAVADYGAAYKIAPIALIVPPVIVNALFPRFSRQAVDDRSGLLRGYRLTIRVLLLGTLPLVAAVSVFAPEIIRAIPGEEYVARGAPALAILIWFVPLSYINGITQYVLIAINRQGAITGAFALTAFWNLVINFALIPFWGIQAAALTTVLSEIILYLPFGRILRSELGPAALWSLLWQPILATVLAGAIFWNLRAYPLIALAIGLSGYLLCLWALRAFTPEDRLLVRRLLGRLPHKQS